MYTECIEKKGGGEEEKGERDVGISIQERVRYKPSVYMMKLNVEGKP